VVASRSNLLLDWVGWGLHWWILLHWLGVRWGRVGGLHFLLLLLHCICSDNSSCRASSWCSGNSLHSRWSTGHCIVDRASHTAVYQDTYGDGDNHAEENAEEDRETNSHTYCGSSFGTSIFIATIKTVVISVTYAGVANTLPTVTLILVAIAVVEVGTAGFVAPVAAVINSVAARGRAYAVAIVTLVLVAVTVAIAADGQSDDQEGQAKNLRHSLGPVVFLSRGAYTR
jgi:hypothetical protein